MKSPIPRLMGALLFAGSVAHATGLQVPATEDPGALWQTSTGRDIGSRSAPAGAPLVVRSLQRFDERATVGRWNGIGRGGAAGLGAGLATASAAGSETRHLRYDRFVYDQRPGAPLRTFVHALHNADVTGADPVSWHRLGVGLERRGAHWRVGAEVSAGSTERAGAALALRWRPDAKWSFGAQALSISNNAPLQAWRSGVWASERSGDLEYAWTARRKLRASVGQLAFSDGSLRIVRTADWQERWLDRPARRLTTTLGWRSVSSSHGAVPSWLAAGNDHLVTLEVATDEVHPVHWARRIQRRLLLWAGLSTSDTQSGAIHGSTYEESVELRRDLSMRYGVGSEQRPLEGTMVRRSFATVALQWRY